MRTLRNWLFKKFFEAFLHLAKDGFLIIILLLISVIGFSQNDIIRYNGVVITNIEPEDYKNIISVIGITHDYNTLYEGTIIWSANTHKYYSIMALEIPVIWSMKDKAFVTDEKNVNELGKSQGVIVNPMIYISHIHSALYNYSVSSPKIRTPLPKYNVVYMTAYEVVLTPAHDLHTVIINTEDTMQNWRIANRYTVFGKCIPYHYYLWQIDSMIRYKVCDKNYPLTSMMNIDEALKKKLIQRDDPVFAFRKDTIQRYNQNIKWIDSLQTDCKILIGSIRSFEQLKEEQKKKK